MSALDTVEPESGSPAPRTSRRSFGRRVVGSGMGRRGGGLPYLLLLPVVAALAIVAVWPIVKIVTLSLQTTSLRQMFTNGGTTWVGFKNYSIILKDSTFWSALWRTVFFMAENVILSMLVGMLLALLLTRVSRWARITLTTVLLFVWSLPAIVASQIFLWLFDNNFGVVNYLLSRIPGVHMQGHDWFVNSNQGLYMVIAAVVIWGAVPFLTLTLHAGLTQVPRELREAAVMDGASSWRVFRNVTLPFLWPLIVIIGTLSIIWDFSVFNQIYAMRSGSPEEGYQNLPVYMYERGFGGQDYNMGSTIAILMIILMFVLILFYIRQLFKIGDAD